MLSVSSRVLLFRHNTARADHVLLYLKDSSSKTIVCNEHCCQDCTRDHYNPSDSAFLFGNFRSRMVSVCKNIRDLESAVDFTRFQCNGGKRCS